jgi:hypothetical protein
VYDCILVGCVDTSHGADAATLGADLAEARDALRCAHALAGRAGAALHVLTVLEPMPTVLELRRGVSQRSSGSHRGAGSAT